MTYTEVLEFSNAVITTPLSFILICILTKDWRLSRRMTKWIEIVILLLLLLLDVLLYGRLGEKAGKNMITLVNFISLTVLHLSLMQYRGGRSLFICFSVALSLLVGASLAEIFGSGVTYQRLIIKAVVYPLLMLITYKYFRRPFFVVMEGIDKGWHRMSVIPIVFCILLTAVLWSGNMYHDREMKMIGLVLCFAVCVIYVVLYYTFCNLQEQYRIKSGYDLLRTQMTSLQKQLELIKESAKEMDIFRHDMRHYLVLLSGCVEQGDLKEAKSLLDSLELSLNTMGSKGRTYTGNILIDSILSEYESRSLAANIRFHVLLTLPESLQDNLVEFAVVIANALENACNACRKIPEGGERAIHIKGRMDGQQYLMEIANTFCGEIEMDRESKRPVSNRQGHGFGTRSITAFAEQNNAYVRYYVDNGWFRLRIILP